MQLRLSLYIKIDHRSQDQRGIDMLFSLTHLSTIC